MNDFLYHAVWTAKKLRRGEDRVAKWCCDVYMKRQLLQILQWHAQPWNDQSRAVWHDGRFLEEWADRRAVEQLGTIFARYDQVEIYQAFAVNASAVSLAGRRDSQQLDFPGYCEAIDIHLH